MKSIESEFFSNQTTFDRALAHLYDTLSYSPSELHEFDMQDQWGRRTASWEDPIVTLPLGIITSSMNTARNIQFEISGRDSSFALTASFYQPVVKSSCVQDGIEVSGNGSADARFTWNWSWRPFHPLQAADVMMLLKNGSTNMGSMAISIPNPNGPFMRNSTRLIFVEQRDKMDIIAEACTIDASWASVRYNFTSSHALSTQNIHAIVNNESLWRDADKQIYLELDFVTYVASYFQFFRPTNLDSNAFTLSLAYALSTLAPSPMENDIGLRYLPQPQKNRILQFLKDKHFGYNYSPTGRYEGPNTSDQPVTVRTSNASTDPSELTLLEVSTVRNTYSFSLSETSAVLAMVVLIVYCAIIVGFIGYSICFGSTVGSWNSAGELFMLALNSKRPSHIRNTSSGVVTTLPYIEPVNVMANIEGSLEIRFANDPNKAASARMRHVVTDVAYS